MSNKNNEAGKKISPAAQFMEELKKRLDQPEPEPQAATLRGFRQFQGLELGIASAPQWKGRMVIAYDLKKCIAKLNEEIGIEVPEEIIAMLLSGLCDDEPDCPIFIELIDQKDITQNAAAPEADHE